MAEVQTLLRTDSKPETTEVLRLIDRMTPDQKTEMLIYANGFLQGFRSASVMQGNKETSKAAAVQTV